MKVKVSEAEREVLDWMVAKCQEAAAGLPAGYWTGAVARGNFSPSTDWAQGGPIIEREGIAIGKGDEQWAAFANADTEEGTQGPTPLIAAMRCYVASKLGDEVEIPEELTNE